MSFAIGVILLLIPSLFFFYLIIFNKDKEENFAFFGYLVLLYLFIISVLIYKLCLFFGASV